MEIIKPYVGIIYLIFILGYWATLAMILYHLKRYGTGKITGTVFYLILGVSIFLTVGATFFYLNI